ncbi:MAG: hypothetical protein E7438_07675 [Ruminococcaceae bacterium]|nr:hypothetical protein [Oscillospiraceae bacterium]
MKKRKIPTAIIITMALLYLFACLPRIVSGALDRCSGESPAYNDMLSVKLEISQDEKQMRFPDKLQLLADAQTVNLNQSQASMTEQEVEAAVAVFLQACQDAGIYEPFEPTHLYMQPKLMYVFSDSPKYLVIWTVTMINKNAPNQTVILDVDDETGAILCPSYNIYRSYTMDDVWERNKTAMDRLTELFFGQLGMQEMADAVEMNAVNGSGYEYKETDGGVSEAIYQFDRTVTVQFTVDGAGGFTVTLL